uniref:Uncharacterized protein n=1 Tax=Anguilla anguilla TaxID=7936 RepID=A0A0E9VTU9_ANGAN
MFVDLFTWCHILLQSSGISGTVDYVRTSFGGMTLKSLPVIFYFLILHDVQIEHSLKNTLKNVAPAVKLMFPMFEPLNRP